MFFLFVGWELAHRTKQTKKRCEAKPRILLSGVEDGAPMPTIESLLQVFTDYFSQYFSTYGLSVVTENIALFR